MMRRDRTIEEMKQRSLGARKWLPREVRSVRPASKRGSKVSRRGFPVKLFGLQTLVAGMILALCRVEARAAERAEWQGRTFSAKFWHFWRHWYPHLFFLFCFEE